MAQMPIQPMPGGAEMHSAARPAALAGQPAMAPARTPYAFDKGGIPGGMLRPGSIDQALFKAQLEAAQKASGLVPRAPAEVSSGAPSFAGIPTLTPAQLAALGAVEEPAGAELTLDIPAQNPPDAGKGAGDLADRFPFLTRKSAPVSPHFPGALAAPTDGAGSTKAAPAASEPPAGAANADTPEASAPAPAAPEASTAGSPAAEPPTVEVPTAAPGAAPATGAKVERGPIPGSRRGADGVWELTRLPDKDEREMLRGQKWRLVEREDSRQLFFGPDGKFGWDDFVDLVNPLQHIPLVNLAYRAITGDEIYGAARMVDVAFGPLASMSTIVDLAMRDTTGGGIAENAVAALFGPGDSHPGDSHPGDATAGDLASINTASAGRTQLADAGPFRRGSNK